VENKITKEQKKLRNELFEKQIEAERIEAERARKEKELLDARTTIVAVDLNLFTSICKKALFLVNGDNGRMEFQFYTIDIKDLCEGKIVEKNYYDKIYKFALLPFEKVEIVNTVRRSTLFSQLADQL
jgi:hypothetical protein